MGKKDKKKKGLGKAKTEAKAAKKAEKAQKKARAATGDEDVEAILAEILAKEAEALHVAQVPDCPPPSPRAAFTMVASPVKDTELIFYGGERFTGDKAMFYSDLYVFNTDRQSWTRFDSPNKPPPRSSHAVALHKNWMYLFGGEFSNPSLSQYRHYKDLWRLDIEDMSWEKIEIRGGPCSRSGHRMAVVKNKLFVFGGFVDNGFDIKYLQDLYYIDLSLDNLKWVKVEVSASDVVPSPRSGYHWVVVDSDILLYGGYCRERVAKAKNISHKGKKKGGSAVEAAMESRGVVLQDMFRLSSETCKWQKVKKSGYGPSARAGFSMVLHKNNMVLFGGVEDDETEDDMESIFYNDMFGLNIEKRKWFPMTLRKKGAKKGRRRRPKPGPAPPGPSSAGPLAAIPEEADEMEGDTIEQMDVEVAGENESDELDTEALEAALKVQQEDDHLPCGRFNAPVCVQKNTLYIAGGGVERQDRELTLDDIWCIDLNKLDEFHQLKELSEECSKWIMTDSEDEEADEEEGEEAEDVEMQDADDDEDGEDEQTKRRHRRDRLRSRVEHCDGSNLTPLVNETLKEFFDRTQKYWIGEVLNTMDYSGKELRRVAFEWSFKRYWEIKPTLKELEDLEAELAREEELEKEFAKAQVDARRVRNRR